MPVSSISGVISTSAYFTAVFLLMLVVMSPVASLYKAASLESAGTLAGGIATQVDDLSPGMVTSIEFGSYPGTGASVSFAGTDVTATVNGYSSSVAVDLPLSTCSLHPGVRYSVSLVNGVVAVA